MYFCSATVFGRRNTFRSTFGLGLLLLAWLGTDATGQSLLPKKAAGTIEVVAPTSKRTLVNVPGSEKSIMELNTNGFKGLAEIHWDAKDQNQILVLLPDLTALPTELTAIADGVSQIVRVLPVNVSQEESDLETAATLPDSTSRDYTVVTQKTHDGEFKFNGKMHQGLRRIQISGDRIAIEPGNKQGLIERLMPGGVSSQDIESVEIFAREVVIGAPILLPGVDVKVYAESLAFRDHGTTASSLNTTPISAIPESTQGKVGDSGQRGGDIFLHVKRFENGDPVTRLISLGGVGQQGGPEQPGKSGSQMGLMPVEPQIGALIRSWNDNDDNVQHFVIGEPLPAGWEVYGNPKNVVWFYRDGQPAEWGTPNTWPSNGLSGAPGGKPGNGGAGGTVHSTIPLNPVSFRLDGGESGSARPVASGGDPGIPDFSVGIRLQTIKAGTAPPFEFWHLNTHKSVKGPDLLSPSADIPKGADGNAVVDLRGWLHPDAAQAILAYAEDLYRLGFISKADDELSFLDNTLNSPGELTEEPVSYLAVKQRVGALRSRITSNLDYLGNPAGWVPPLNLASTLRLLADDVKASSRTLVLTETIRIAAESGTARGQDLIKSRDSATADLLNFDSIISELANSVPKLQAEAATIADSEANLLKNVRQREEFLHHTAEDLANPKTSFLVQALKTVGAIAKVVPVGQPILGAVGSGMDLLSNIDQNSPWDTISQLSSVASQFSDENIATSLASYKKTVKDIQNMDPNNPKEFFSNLSTAASAIGKSIGDFKRLQDSSRAPASKVEAILQQLKAGDQSLKEITDAADDLTAKKKLLASQIDISVNKIGELTSQITSLTVRIDSLNRDIVQAQDIVDHPAIVAAKEISRNLRQRLDYYHYLVIKAYEYYSGKPFQGNRRAAGTADNMIDLLAKSNNDPEKAALAFEAVYTEEIRSLGRQIVQTLTDEGQLNERQIDLVFSEGSSEVTALNKMLAATAGKTADLFVNFDDQDLIPQTHLKARLTKVKVVECKCSLTNAVSGSANLNIDFLTGPSGTINTKTRRIKFRQTFVSTFWGATVDLTKQASNISVVTQPEDLGQVLGQFLNLPGTKTYLTAPPIHPGISIRARLQATDTTAIAKINGLRIKLTYSYLPVLDARAIRVTSTVPLGLQPFYYVSTSDLAGMQSGLSSFTRIYGIGTPVEIVAQPTIGSAVFDGWYLKHKLVGTGNHLIVPDGPDSYLYEARYK